jgi:hypothetical protein
MASQELIQFKHEIMKKIRDEYSLRLENQVERCKQFYNVKEEVGPMLHSSYDIIIDDIMNGGDKDEAIEKWFSMMDEFFDDYEKKRGE